MKKIIIEYDEELKIPVVEAQGITSPPEIIGILTEAIWSLEVMKKTVTFDLIKQAVAKEEAEMYENLRKQNEEQLKNIEVEKGEGKPGFSKIEIGMIKSEIYLTKKGLIPYPRVLICLESSDYWKINKGEIYIYDSRFENMYRIMRDHSLGVMIPRKYFRRLTEEEINIIANFTP